MQVWIDIDNPPQVQYLVPFKLALERAGADVVLTARDHSITFDLLRARHIDFVPVGRSFGNHAGSKLWGTARRAGSLVARFRKNRPALALCSSRSAALAAAALRIPSYVICDYEHVELDTYRRFGAHLIFPACIGAETFAKKGFSRNKLIPFDGIKEDVTFSEIDVAAVRPYSFGTDAGELPLVLFRPPAAEAHYYQDASGELAVQAMHHLARNERSRVVFFPRYRWQVDEMEKAPWANKPIVLEKGVEFVSLLKALDAVVVSGGTMAREAAYLGIPAYSIFKGEKCAVDRHLESLGKLTFISRTEELDRIRVERIERSMEVASARRVVDRLVQELVGRVDAR